jgi:hypothetical protein
VTWERGRVDTTRRDPAPAWWKEKHMPGWLILILIGVVLVILGVATEIGQFLI